MPTQESLDALVSADHAALCNTTLPTVLAKPFVDDVCDGDSNIAIRQDRNVRGQSCPLSGYGWLSNLCYQNYSLNAQGQCATANVAVFNNWFRHRTLECPFATYWDAGIKRCRPIRSQPEKDKMCPVRSNPVVVTSGNKIEREVDYAGTGLTAGLEFTRTYSSQMSFTAASPPDVTKWPIGAGWRHSYERRVIAHSNGIQYTAQRQDGRQIYFEKSGSVLVPDPDERIALTQEADGSFRLRNEQNETEHYDANGRLIAIHGPDYVVSLSYDAWGRLRTVANQAGRALVFGYQNATFQRMTSLTLPDGGTLQFGYLTDTAIAMVGALETVTH